MRLQQLLYVKEIARCRSMNQAAVHLYISQPSLSEAIRDLEKEFGITIFERSRRGVSLTAEGIEFLQLADKVIADADELRNHYLIKNDVTRLHLQISCQHYAFVIDAFIHFLRTFQQERYTISLKETETITALEDVYLKKSAFSIVAITGENSHYIHQVLDKWALSFHVLCPVIPHVFMNIHHPLARRQSATLDDIRPYPLIQYAQSAATRYADEELVTLDDHDKIIYSYDRGTTNNLLASTDCLNIGTGYLIPAVMPSAITAIPLSGLTVQAQIGYVQLHAQPSNEIIDALIQGIQESLRTYDPGR